MRARQALFVLLVAFHVPVLADYVEVGRPATVKAAPDRDATVLLRADDGDTFLLAADQQTNGYYQVQIPQGSGWIYRTLARRFPGNPPSTPGTPTPPTGTPPAQPFTGTFQIHFLDVGTGDSAIIDMGDREIVIDGGDSVRVVHDYAARTGIIDGPIELVVVTHGDSDHWRGLTRLLGFDGQATASHSVLEFWEPGYGSETASTQAFIDAVDPKFVIFSASTKHHLPKDTTAQRYVNSERVILRTDEHLENDVDHIICGLDANQELDCNFASVLVQ